MGEGCVHAADCTVFDDFGQQKPDRGGGVVAGFWRFARSREGSDFGFAEELSRAK